MTLDDEWINLIIEAKSLGINIEDIRSFLHLESLNNQNNGEKWVTACIQNDQN